MTRRCIPNPGSPWTRCVSSCSRTISMCANLFARRRSIRTTTKRWAIPPAASSLRVITIRLALLLCAAADADGCQGRRVRLRRSDIYAPPIFTWMMRQSCFFSLRARRKPVTSSTAPDRQPSPYGRWPKQSERPFAVKLHLHQCIAERPNLLNPHAHHIARLQELFPRQAYPRRRSGKNQIPRMKCEPGGQLGDLLSEREDHFACVRILLEHIVHP